MSCGATNGVFVLTVAKVQWLWLVPHRRLWKALLQAFCLTLRELDMVFQIYHILCGTCFSFGAWIVTFINF